MNHFHTVEQAYTHIRREVVRHAIMITCDYRENLGAVMASKSFRSGQNIPSSTKSLSLLAIGKATTLLDREFPLMEPSVHTMEI